jgi:hypothetical protein
MRVKVQVVESNKGFSLYIDDNWVAGVKPRAPDRVEHSFDVDVDKVIKLLNKVGENDEGQ